MFELNILPDIQINAESRLPVLSDYAAPLNEKIIPSWTRKTAIALYLFMQQKNRHMGGFYFGFYIYLDLILATTYSSVA